MPSMVDCQKTDIAWTCIVALSLESREKFGFVDEKVHVLDRIEILCMGVTGLLELCYVDLSSSIGRYGLLLTTRRDV